MYIYIYIYIYIIDESTTLVCGTSTIYIIYVSPIGVDHHLDVCVHMHVHVHVRASDAYDETIASYTVYMHIINICG
jgi:hypothetical protein